MSQHHADRGPDPHSTSNPSQRRRTGQLPMYKVVLLRDPALGTKRWFTHERICERMRAGELSDGVTGRYALSPAEGFAEAFPGAVATPIFAQLAVSAPLLIRADPARSPQ